jgi:predicted dehydrogenase
VEEPTNWRHRLEQSGGQLVFHCCHLLDFFYWTGGMFDSVIANAKMSWSRPHEEVELTAAFDFEAGGQATFNLSQHSHQNIQFGIIHTRKYGIYYEWGIHTHVRVYTTRNRSVDEYYEWTEAEMNSMPELNRDRMQMAEFIAAYKSGGPMPIPLSEGLLAYDAAMRVRESYRAGRKVSIDMPTI